ncbi:MAG: hypothetical protein CVV56_06275 [Tenericutes bacterium HGW-Tenericutes-1]|nr:MAG: hypothetical protein CVV56_06275 [Tenericutes bacterium HGW-Tenericutes-1]
MKTTFFQYRGNLKLLIIVIILSPFLEILNYQINISMIGHWNFEIFLRDQLLTLAFFLSAMMVFSKRILVRICVTSESLVFSLFGKKLNEIHWSNITSMKLSKHFLKLKMIITEAKSDKSSEIDINYTELLVFYELCSFQPIRNEIKKNLDIWATIK